MKVLHILMAWIAMVVLGFWGIYGLLVYVGLLFSAFGDK